MKSILLLSLLLSHTTFAGTQSDACKRKEELYAKFQIHETNLAKASEGDSSINAEEEQAQMKKLSTAYKKAEQRCKD